MEDLGNIKVALVCDWLVGVGGAERVLLSLHQLFPQAPIYTSQYDPKAISWFHDADVRTLWLQHLPKGLRKFLPLLRAISFSRLDLSDYDLIISSSGAEAKAVKTDSTSIHICYCHSPTQYYWRRYDEYIKSPGFKYFGWLAKIGLKLLVKPMRRWDKRAAQKPDYLITNSTFSQSEIKRCYGRESTVIHPPVDTERFKDTGQKRAGFVIAGRQTPYKKTDLAIAACTKLRMKLTVLGDGPDHKKLVHMAGETITFLTKISDHSLAQHLGSAEAFIFPVKEDFGIVAVEALAAGTPVIAYKGGGALDYIADSKTGLFFPRQTTASLIQALESFNPQNFDSNYLKKFASQFSVTEFKNQLRDYLISVIK
ncbi:MAG: glycosyltransferase [Candidatus Saccharimonadales bacterium]|jgi:glycosyltransferase involved in cell wall biosynthesis